MRRHHRPDIVERVAREICRVTCPMVAGRHACRIECGAGGDVLMRAIHQAEAALAEIGRIQAEPEARAG